MAQLFLPKSFTFAFKFFVYILILSVFDCIEVYGAGNSLGSCPGCQPLNSSGGNWRFQKEYSDEFNGTTLDDQKWNNSVPSWGFTWSWLPENAFLSNGCLVLQAKSEKNKRVHKPLFESTSHIGILDLNYTSGIVKSKAKSVKHGYFEARIKSTPVFPGLVPAFWLYKIYNNQWTEIDIVELNQEDTDSRIIDMNLHVFQHPDLDNGVRKKPGKHFYIYFDYKLSSEPSQEFHVYGLEWDKKNIKWYVDGQLVHVVANKYWNQPLDVVMSLGLRSPFKGSTSMISIGEEAKTYVDYIRVWKR